jgi:hypothetical protein
MRPHIGGDLGDPVADFIIALEVFQIGSRKQSLAGGVSNVRQLARVGIPLYGTAFTLENYCGSTETLVVNFIVICYSNFLNHAATPACQRMRRIEPAGNADTACPNALKLSGVLQDVP